MYLILILYHLVFQSYSSLWITDYNVYSFTCIYYNAKSSQMYTTLNDRLIPITIARELIVHIFLNNYIAWRLIFLNINILWFNQNIRQLALTSPYQFFAIHLRFRFLLKIYAIKYKQHITKNLMECFNS